MTRKFLNVHVANLGPLDGELPGSDGLVREFIAVLLAPLLFWGNFMKFLNSAIEAVLSKRILWEIANLGCWGSAR